MEILKIIDHIGRNSTALLAALKEKSKLEYYPKGSILLKEGAICRKLYFTQKGCLRFFYIDEEGKDITHWFSFEGDFITEVNSLYSQAPSDFYLETLEDCELLTFTLENMEMLSNNFPAFNKMEKSI